MAGFATLTAPSWISCQKSAGLPALFIAAIEALVGTVLQDFVFALVRSARTHLSLGDPDATASDRNPEFCGVGGGVQRVVSAQTQRCMWQRAGGGGTTTGLGVIGALRVRSDKQARPESEGVPKPYENCRAT
jgi:hypothetical protein